MRRGTLVFGALATAAGGAFALRKAKLGEDLDWDLLEKPGRVIDIDGYGVHYVEAGDGPAIVLIHGFGGSVFTFREMVPRLARAHRVVAVDLKGCGYSERGESAGLSHGDQVEMLRRLMRELRIDHAVFVGHSLGGAVAQRFAATQPEMVDALVLAASVTGDERLAEHLSRGVPRGLGRALEIVTAAASRAVRPGSTLAAAAGRFSNMRLVARRLVTLWSHDPTAVGADILRGYETPMRIRGTLVATFRALRETARDAPLDRSRITMPVLLLYAAADRTAPLTVAERLRRHLPQARIAIIEDAAHLLLEEQPGACARAIDEFLSDPETKAAAPP